MEPLTAKRIKDGLYEYTFGGDLTFKIARIVDGDKWSDNRKWYYVNANDANEGGDDWFNSKGAALSALLEYVPRRVWMARYGWVMGPAANE